jgi:spermidine/putrescine transport system substrate-binding protein
MQLSRREFLAAASTMIATGCGLRPGNDSAAQTVQPAVVNGASQVLDPALRLALPQGAVDMQNVHTFASQTRTKVTVGDLPPDSDFLLNLAAGEQDSPKHRIDLALVDQSTLVYLRDQGFLEPIDRSLVPNLAELGSVFAKPPYDPNGTFSVGKDYTVIGYATTASGQGGPIDSWAGFFRLAAAYPGRVAVPDDPELVIGAALLAVGRPWSAAGSGDLAAARKLLAGLRGALVVGGPLERTGLRTLLAALCSGAGFRTPPLGVRFVVPAEGSVIRMRSYCILALAPDPVTAHWWLNACLNPNVAWRDVLASGRASTVSQVDYLLPDDVLANPAIYPPAALSDRLQFAVVPAAAAVARADLWNSVKP